MLNTVRNVRAHACVAFQRSHRAVDDDFDPKLLRRSAIVRKQNRLVTIARRKKMNYSRYDWLRRSIRRKRRYISRARATVENH